MYRKYIDLPTYIKLGKKKVFDLFKIELRQFNYLECKMFISYCPLLKRIKYIDTYINK